MENYSCNRCGYISNIKGNLVRHLKSNTCKPFIKDVECSVQLRLLTQRHLNEKTYECKFCKKEFNNTGNKSVHQKRCKEKLEQAQKIINNINNTTNNTEQITNNTTNNTTNNNTTNNVNSPNNTINTNNITNININQFGKENVEYILNDPNIGKIINEVLKDRIVGYFNFLKMVHYHPEHPENCNIKKTNLKKICITFFNGKEFESVPTKEACERICENLNKYLSKCIDDNIDEIDERKLNKFMHEVGVHVELNLDCGNLGIDPDDKKEKLVHSYIEESLVTLSKEK